MKKPAKSKKADWKARWKKLQAEAKELRAEMAAGKAKRPEMKISAEARAAAKQRKPKVLPQGLTSPFQIPAAPPWAKEAIASMQHGMAMDDVSEITTAQIWASSGYNLAWSEGLAFLGYSVLSEMAQRPEYRRMSETLAEEATRKWVTLQATGDKGAATDKSKTEKIKKIMDEWDRLNVKDAFCKVSELDGFFGRGHLYADQGDGDNPGELVTDIGDGRSAASKAKVSPQKPIIAWRTVEPVWTYPLDYNSNDPLSANWYNPLTWIVMSKRIHKSRLLTFVARPVPDMLKPAYFFGGLSLTQIAKPYVDNWLRTRESVSDVISAFSVFVLSSNLAESLMVGGPAAMQRVDVFNDMRDTRGTMVIDKETEAFQNVSVPLGGLDVLQAQSQEHMCSVAGEPKIKLLGLDPAGLNASSEGEIRTFYDRVAAYQNRFFRPGLTRVLYLTQLSLFGEVDPAITIKFEPLLEIDEEKQSRVRKQDADTDQVLIDSGVLHPEDSRKRVADDPDSPYHGLNPDDVPDLMEEEEQGLEPQGGRPQPQAEAPGKPAGKPAAKAPAKEAA